MLDHKKFTALYQKHFAVVRRVIARKGITGADLDEVTQEVWADLWKNRHVWPTPEPLNPSAYLAECAQKKAKMHFRAAGAIKRAGFHLPLEEDRTSTANLKLSCAPNAENVVEQTSLGTFLRRLAEKIGGEKKKTMLDNLEQQRSAPIEEQPSGVRRGYRRMIASCRRQLGIPVKEPRSFRVADPLSHLAGVMRGGINVMNQPEVELSDAE